ncbi:MAG: hypothetical protein E7409_07450 [Ruminococcaceae bacterium]|nr:hypothetical protein [Oscillospiraceae bacterium]
MFKFVSKELTAAATLSVPLPSTPAIAYFTPTMREMISSSAFLPLWIIFFSREFNHGARLVVS